MLYYVIVLVMDKMMRQYYHDLWWRLKADGYNIIKGLKESTKLQWNGDKDLADGSLQKQY